MEENIANKPIYEISDDAFQLSKWRISNVNHCFIHDEAKCIH